MSAHKVHHGSLHDAMRIKVGTLKSLLGEAKPMRPPGSREVAREAWTELLAYLQETYDDVVETTESYQHQVDWCAMFELPEGVHDDEVKAERRLDEICVECAGIIHMVTGLPQLKGVDSHRVRIDDKFVLRLHADYDDSGAVMLDMGLDMLRKPITEAADMSSKDIEATFTEAFDEVVAYLKDNYAGAVSGVYDGGARRIVSFNPPVDVADASKLRFSTEEHNVTQEVVKEIENVLALVTGLPKLSDTARVYDGVRLDDTNVLTFNLVRSKHGHFKCTFEVIDHGGSGRPRRRQMGEGTKRDDTHIIEEAWLELKQYAGESFENVKFSGNIIAFDTPSEGYDHNTETWMLKLQHELVQVVHLATGLTIVKGTRSVHEGWWYLSLDPTTELVCAVRPMAGKKSAYERVRVELYIREIVSEVLDGFGNKSNGKDGVAGNLRNGVPLTGHTGGNVLTDEENEEEKLLRAACVLIVAEDGKVLAVSRKDNPNAWGLPGGKVDPGETEQQAAARELQEETGLTAKRLSQVFSADDGEYMTTTFACEAEGEIDTDESGVIRWVEPAILLDPGTSPFSDYNRALFKKLGRVR